MDIYTPSAIPRYENRTNCWMRLRIDVAREEIGDFCPLKLVALVVYGILSTSASPPSPAPPSNFWSVIEGWGKTWMWENLTI
jgi:hypothetical protein